MSKRSNLLTALSFAVAAAIFVAAPGAAFAQAPAPTAPTAPVKPQPKVMPKKPGAITPAERKRCQDQHTACMKAAAKSPDMTKKPTDKKDMKKGGKDMKKGGITPAEKARCDQRMQACMKAAAAPNKPKTK